MIVDEMDILTTVFLKTDNEKVYYPNAVLATKPISNFNRSPEMGDSVDFVLDFSTSVEKIAELKAKIKAYVNSIISIMFIYTQILSGAEFLPLKQGALIYFLKYFISQCSINSGPINPIFDMLEGF